MEKVIIKMEVAADSIFYLNFNLQKKKNIKKKCY